MPRETPPELRRQLELIPTMTTADLAARLEELSGERPHTPNKRYLEKRVAWWEQSAFYGESLSEATRARAHELARIGDLRLAAPSVSRGERTVTRTVKLHRQPTLPPVGTVIVRPYHGRELRLTILENGFELDGVIYRSLSAAANAVTESHCSGPAFWRLVERTRK